MSNISEELYKTSNRIKLNKISQELKNIENKTKTQHMKHSKIEQEIISELKKIVENLIQIREDL